MYELYVAAASMGLREIFTWCRVMAPFGGRQGMRPVRATHGGAPDTRLQG